MRSTPSRLAITGKKNPNAKPLLKYSKARRKTESDVARAIPRALAANLQFARHPKKHSSRSLQRLHELVLQDSPSHWTTPTPRSESGILIASRDVGRARTWLRYLDSFIDLLRRLTPHQGAYRRKISASQRIDHASDTPNYHYRTELPSSSAESGLGAALRRVGWDRKAAYLAEMSARGFEIPA